VCDFNLAIRFYKHIIAYSLTYRCIPLGLNLSSNEITPSFEFNELGFMGPIACLSKNKKVSWQIQKNFLDTQVTKFPWVELAIGEDGQMHHVR